MDAYQRLAQELSVHLPRASSRRVTRKAALAAIADLPLASPAQAMREIEQLLDGMLATAWRGGERIPVLARLRGPVESLCQGIAQAISAERHPLQATGAELVAAAQQLTWNLACNDALGLHELCAPAGRVPRFKGKAAAEACTSGLWHAGQVLGWAYLRYRAPPPGVWRFIHALHATADELGVANQANDTSRVEGSPASARDAYAQALLLAMSNPYRFSAPELQQARAVVGCVAGHCVFADEGAEGVAIDIGADAGPDRTAAECAVSGAYSLVLDVQPAVRVLKYHIASSFAAAGAIELPRPGGAVTTSAAFLRRLAAGWTSVARRHARLPASYTLDLAVGMHAVHYALAGNVDFATFLSQVHRAATDDAGAQEPVAAWQVAADALRPEALRAEVLEQGEGGYRLRLHGSEDRRLRVGEVVALSPPPANDAPDERDWMVGVVRWLRLEGEHARMGIELLHRVARAAGLRPLAAGGGMPAPLRAVEVSGSGDTDHLLLLVSHALAPSIVAVEIALPALASGWTSRATVATWRVGDAEAVGPACFRVKLERARSDGQG